MGTETKLFMKTRYNAVVLKLWTVQIDFVIIEQIINTSMSKSSALSFFIDR